MKNAIWLLVGFVAACKTPDPTSGDCPFKIDYESAFATIRIADGKLFYSQTRYDVPENSPVAHGDPITTIIHQNKALSQQKLSDLQRVATDAGFWQLEKNAYGADDAQRYYPYILRIEQACRQKEVLFRSNPDAAAAPAAFQAVENALLELVGQ